MEEQQNEPPGPDQPMEVDQAPAAATETPEETWKPPTADEIR